MPSGELQESDTRDSTRESCGGDYVTRVPDRNGSATLPLLKVVYLLAVTAIAFMAPAFATTRPARWFVVPALLAFQIVIERRDRHADMDERIGSHRRQQVDVALDQR